ncbi:MAG: ATP-binding cassette domain-containing protein [Ferrimicrobium sp.]|nr:ATP-binding cassette domain-containing protein [Ferrimicrobium sp.]
MLEAEFLVRRPASRVALSLSVEPGRRLGIFGPSGAGKTTALEVLAGLVVPTSGSVRLGDVLLSDVGSHAPATFVPPNERCIGLIAQRPQLFPHLNVRRNVLYGKNVLPMEQVDALIERLELGSLLDERPSRLSGGQAQRVAIARTLARVNKALLLDEPFQGLDERLRRELLDLLDELLAPLMIPVVMVAHELELVALFADDLVVIADGQAVGAGSVQTLLREPPTISVASYVGYTNFFALDRATLIGVRPDRIVPEALPRAGYVASVSIRAMRDVGTGVRFRLQLHDQEVTVTFPDDRLATQADPQVTLLDPPVFTSDGVFVRRWIGSVIGRDDGRQGR